MSPCPGNPDSQSSGTRLSPCPKYRGHLRQLWRATTQYFDRDFAAALERCTRSYACPGYVSPYQYIVGSLAYLGRLPEARAMLGQIGARFTDADRRFVEQRLPWLRPKDYVLRIKGLRLAAEAPR